MKKFVLEFLHRGLISAGIGPIVLAFVYLILQQAAGVEMLSVKQVCVGVFSITVLAFVAGGMNAIYQIERLSLMAAIFIHGGVLYIGYLGMYLVNDWLDWGLTPIIVFSAIFAVGYIVIWVIIYSVIRRKTAQLNENLIKRQENR